MSTRPTENNPPPSEENRNARTLSPPPTLVNGVDTTTLMATVNAITLEGDIDLRGFLGLDATVPRGYTAIRVVFRARGTADNVARLRELAEFSPVFNTLSQGSRVEVTVEPK